MLLLDHAGQVSRELREQPSASAWTQAQTFNVVLRVNGQPVNPVAPHTFPQLGGVRYCPGSALALLLWCKARDQPEADRLHGGGATPKRSSRAQGRGRVDAE